MEELLGQKYLIVICMYKLGFIDSYTESESCFFFFFSSFLFSFFVFSMTYQCKREGFLQRIKDEEGEGCNIYGFLDVNKVGGNFHFAPGKSFQQSNVHVHDVQTFQKDSFNVRLVSFNLYICSTLWF